MYQRVSVLPYWNALVLLHFGHVLPWREYVVSMRQTHDTARMRRRTHVPYAVPYGMPYGVRTACPGTCLRRAYACPWYVFSVAVGSALPNMPRE